MTKRDSTAVASSEAADNTLIEHPLTRDGLIDLNGYLSNLTSRDSVRFEMEDYDEEIGELRVWDVDQHSNGVVVTFRNQIKAMPVTEYCDSLASSAKRLRVWWDDESEFPAIARLQLYEAGEGATPIGTVTSVDYGNPEDHRNSETPNYTLTVSLSVSGEWKRKRDHHENQ